MDLLIDTQHTFSEAQEALWSDAKIDGRAVFSVRETYKLHRSRLIEVQTDVERLRWVLKGCKGHVLSATAREHCKDNSSSRSPLYVFSGVMDDIFTRVAEQIGQNYGEIIKFIESWPVYAEGAMSVESIRRMQQPMHPDHTHSPTLQPAESTTSDKIRVFIRKRPLLPFEQQVNEWDVVSIPERRTLTVHEGRVAQSGRRLVMHLAHYTADAVVGKDILSLFRNEVDLFRPRKPQTKREEGQESPYLTVLLYGQTGTGKTFTMRELVGEFFSRTEAQAKEGESFHLELQCFEVLHRSSTVYDLLDARKQVKLLEDGRRQVHSKSKRVRVPGSDAAAAAGVMEGAMELRMSEATERNALSSRSHAFFIITAVRGPVPEHAGGVGSVRDEDVIEKLRLVDLAGSERNFETQDMTSAQHRQSAEINSSLMVLKSCLRAIAQRSSSSKTHQTQTQTQTQTQATAASAEQADGSVSVETKEGSAAHQQSASTSAAGGGVREGGAGKLAKVPFRESRLTHLLQDCFLAASPALDDPSALGVDSRDEEPRAEGEGARAKAGSRALRSKLIIVATVSPCARDAIHTRNTLNHVCDLGADPEFAIKNCILDLPLYLFDPTKQGRYIAEWTEEEVSMWLGNVAHGRFSRLVLPEGKRDGTGLLSLTPTNLAEMFETETLRNARRSEEGASWNLMAPDSVGKLGRLFYRAVQRAKHDSAIKVKLVQAVPP